MTYIDFKGMLDVVGNTIHLRGCNMYVYVCVCSAVRLLLNVCHFRKHLRFYGATKSGFEMYRQTHVHLSINILVQNNKI